MSTAAELAARWYVGPALWCGPSGERVSGAAAARLLRAAGQVLAEDGWDPHRIGIADALAAAALSVGSVDSVRVAERCLELVLCARSGAYAVDYRLWERTVDRQPAEVQELIGSAAAFAETHGPGEVS